jgi:hypothetical protein
MSEGSFLTSIKDSANSAYDSAYNLGKDPKNKSVPSGKGKGKKYSSIKKSDPTKTEVTSNNKPDNVLSSNNKTGPLEPITNFGKTSSFIGQEFKEEIPEIAGNGRPYSQFQPSFEFQLPAEGGKPPAKPKGSGKSKSTSKTKKPAAAKQEPAPTGPGVSDGAAPYSGFNRYSLFKYRGTPLNGKVRGTAVTHADYNLIDPATLIEPTISNIIQQTTEKGALGYRYHYSDFALCKYGGKIPNNYLITLRRFPFPVEDDIITPFIIGEDGKKQDAKSPDIARAVTWISEETGNSLSEILSLTYGYTWKEVEAQVQTITSTNNENSGGKLGKALMGNKIGKAFMGAGQGMNGVDVKTAEAHGAGFDPLKGTYPNHIFGPVNKIASMLVRDDKGLSFDKEFTLKFQYEMKGLMGANPKVMFMDQFANILALTYSTAPFWGGETRYLGSGSIGRPFGDIAKLRSGDYKGFLTSVLGQLSSMATNIVDDIKANGLGGSKLTSNLLGGALMDLFNSPQGGEVANALLTGEATGQWHITVGNPLNPMIVMGNLCLQDTKITFKDGVGLQDFPETMEVEIKLKPGRPRDKSEIESMFNAGRGRFYLKPKDGADINKLHEVSGYGDSTGTSKQSVEGKGNPGSPFDIAFRKFAND